MEAAGLPVTPYHVDVPSFGDWGFVLAARERRPALRLPPGGPRLRSLDASALRAAGVFPPDRGLRPVEVSTLARPVVLGYARSGWQAY